jgi:hypothetical protein
MRLEEVLLRMTGIFLIVELLLFAVNPVPDTKEKWKAKMLWMLRRLSYYLACLVAAVWLHTL